MNIGNLRRAIRSDAFISKEFIFGIYLRDNVRYPTSALSLLLHLAGNNFSMCERHRALFPFIDACVEQIICPKCIPSLFLLSRRPRDIFRLASKVSWGKSWRANERTRTKIPRVVFTLSCDCDPPKSSEIVFAAWDRHVKTTSRICDSVATLSQPRIVHMSDERENGINATQGSCFLFSAGESLLAFHRTNVSELVTASSTSARFLARLLRYAQILRALIRFNPI
jgi:hypothetical protein